ncbi:hypothetical protein, partial [Pseudomonas lactis]
WGRVGGLDGASGHRSKKPQISRRGLFHFIFGAPAPFEPAGIALVFKGFCLLVVSKGYTRGYTALSAGAFLARFTLAEKPSRYVVPSPTNGNVIAITRHKCKGMVVTTTPLMDQSKSG